MPSRIKTWSLTSLHQRWMKTGGRLLKQARYYRLLLSEGHLNRRLFGDTLRRIWALLVPGVEGFNGGCETWAAKERSCRPTKTSAIMQTHYNNTDELLSHRLDLTSVVSG